MYSFWDVNVAMLEGSVTTLQMFVLTLLFALLWPDHLLRCYEPFLPPPVADQDLCVDHPRLTADAPDPHCVLRPRPAVRLEGPAPLHGGLVTFVINYACYFSEIYRGGIQGVPQGQREAGQVLGMTRGQIFFRVTLLQMVKRVVPPCPMRSSPW